MPKPTARFQFEHRIAAWARDTSVALTGSACSFFLGFRRDGTARRLYFAPVGSSVDGERKLALAEQYRSWFLFATYADDPGTVYVEWLELPDTWAERWLGGLEPEDFAEVGPSTSLPVAPPERWPTSWRAIVASG